MTGEDAPELFIDISVQDPEWEQINAIENLIRAGAETTVELCPLPRKLTGKKLEASIVLANDALIRVLNHEYRGKDMPTNVLSFAALDSDDPIPDELAALGDVILSFQTIQTEAREQGKFVEDHIVHLAVHGMLHLMGYDHREEGEASVMEALEIRILEKLGIQNPYTETISMP